jgi:hypothetical protein
MCSDDRQSCTEDMVDISLKGFNVVYGIAGIGTAIASIIGTAGLATLIAAFGIIAGSGEVVSGAFKLSTHLASFPLCSDADRNVTSRNMDRSTDDLVDKLRQTCRKFIE